MKKHLLKLIIVCGLIAMSADLRAFTAVTSGPWSDANTWGGVGPGSTVTNQDIIIPSGITVDFDMDVAFNGQLNSFWVTGTLNGSITNELNLVAGTLTGSGTIFIRKLSLGGPTAFYSFTGPISVDVFRNEGTVANLASIVTVYDTLDLDQGAVVIGGGSDLQLMLNSNVRVNNGVLLNNGGIFTTGFPYDVWYYGGTKTIGEELNSASTRDVHVLLNSNASDLTLAHNVLVNGMLQMMTGHVVLNGNRLTLYGDLVANPGAMFESAGSSQMEISGSGGALSSSLNFAVGSSLDKLIISRAPYTIELGSELTITGVLHLVEGHFQIDSLANLVMGSGSIIRRADGHMMAVGSFDGSQQYSVEYVSDSLSTGIELSGSGIFNVTINLWYPYRLVHLTQDLTVPGAFMLINGQFNLNGFDLNLQGTFDQESDAELWGDLNSTLTMSMSSSVNDTLWMRLQAYPLDEIVIDLPVSSTLTLGANLFTTRITFLSGKLDVGNSVLKLGSANPMITGADDTKYIVTSGWGYLRINITLNDPYMEYPIGTASAYSPVAIRQVGSATTGYISVRVLEGVWTNGFNGTDISATDAVVNKTWLVVADSGVVVNMDFRAGWIASSEVNGFDRTQCFVKNYYNNTWDSNTPGAAAVGSNNTYTIERLGIPNDGFFTVVDITVPLEVEEPATPVVGIYPNPTVDVISVQVPNPANDMIKYEIFDATGRLVLSTTCSGERNQIDFSAYDAGSYTMRITNLTTSEVTAHKIIKS